MSGEPTPGPWKADRDQPYGVQPRVHAADGRLVAVFGNAERSRQDQWEADAILGAAAPDMYAALGEVMAAFRAYQSKPGPSGFQRIAAAEKQADAALAKADTTEGE